MAKKKTGDASVEEIPLVLVEFDHSKETFREALGIAEEDREKGEAIMHLFMTKCFEAGSRSKLAEIILGNVNNPHVLFLLTKTTMDMMHTIIEDAKAKEV